MRRFLVQFSESEASNHTPSLADFTTTTPELKFSVHTGTADRDPTRMGDRAAAGSRRRPRVRGSRMDAGPRLPGRAPLQMVAGRHCRVVVRQHLTADGYDGRYRVRGRPRSQPRNVAQEGAAAGRGGSRRWVTGLRRYSALTEVVDGRPQAVGRDVERRKRDRQPETPPARASWIQVEHAAGRLDLGHMGMAGDDDVDAERNRIDL
jgi:hypothetical protein